MMIKAQSVWDLGIRSLMKRKRTLSAMPSREKPRRFIDKVMSEQGGMICSLLAGPSVPDRLPGRSRLDQSCCSELQTNKEHFNKKKVGMTVLLDTEDENLG